MLRGHSAIARESDLPVVVSAPGAAIGYQPIRGKPHSYSLSTKPWYQASQRVFDNSFLSEYRGLRGEEEEKKARGLEQEILHPSVKASYSDTY